MAKIIAISSFVARGSVGLRAIMAALDRLRHEVIACPTTVLSSHLGHGRSGGAPIPPETFEDILSALEGNGWLNEADVLLTGYLPTTRHVEAVARAIDRLAARRPDAAVVCDPVLGDLPGGLYVPETVAEAVRDRLVPRASHLKPNLFELGFLRGAPLDPAPELDDVVAAARALAPPVVLTSSIAMGNDRLANLLVTAGDAQHCSVAKEARVPHGTGDLLAAMFAGHVAAGRTPLDATAAASAAVASAIAASRGHDELQLFDATPWHEAPPLIMARPNID